MALTLIDSVLVTSTTSQIDFTGIPGTFASLQMRAKVASSLTSSPGVAGYGLNFNDDFSTNYVTNSARRGQSTTTSVGTLSVAKNTVDNEADMYFVNNEYTGQAATVFDYAVIDISNYANPNMWTVTRALHGFIEYNDDWGYIIATHSSWRNTDTVTKISVCVDSFRVGSKIELYGYEA